MRLDLKALATRNWKNSRPFVVFLFFFCIFIEMMLFHFLNFRSILISSIVKSPIDALAFYLPKLGIALCVSSFLFISKRGYWSIVFLLLLNIWILANSIYFRSYDSVLDLSAIKMADNMSGYWSSVFYYLQWSDLMCFAITIFYIVFFFLCRRNGKKNISVFLVIFVLSYVLNLLGVECKRICFKRDFYATDNLEHYFNPFSKDMRWRMISLHSVRCVKEFSILHQVGFILNDSFSAFDENCKLTEEEKDFVDNSLLLKQCNESFSNPLIIVVFESLEDWAINPVVTPNLWNYMSDHSYLRCRTIKPQVAGGNSMDGQMIINTGLLPISEGAVAFTFPNRKLPNIAECSKGENAVIVPHDVHVWNQMYMSWNFGYDTTISVSPDELELFSKAVELRHDSFQVIQIITGASHAPFTYGAQRSTLELPNNMPSYLSQYMKSVHYTDECMKLLLDALENDSTFSDAILVVAADHTILYGNRRMESEKCIREMGYNWGVERNTSAFLLFSGQDNIRIIDGVETYQMDIYPTIINELGINTNWRGVGVSLYHPYKCENRTISEESAQYISNKLIRSDYLNHKK